MRGQGKPEPFTGIAGGPGEFTAEPALPSCRFMDTIHHELRRAVTSTHEQVADCVGIIDDDRDVREYIGRMLGKVGLDVRLFGSAPEFIADVEARRRCACLVVDVRLPGISGVELQKQLLLQPPAPAIVFITGYADVPMVVDAMRRGAVNFLEKPFREQELVDSVQRALLAGRAARAEHEQQRVRTERRALLTPREESVLLCMLRGLRAREIATELGMATKTAEGHRARVMHKMEAASIAQLVAICTTVDTHP
jgi:FixJ family two-component response regulator